MGNLFFDILPYEIQYYIYAIRLSNALASKYYSRIAQKMEFANIILKFQERGYSLHHNDDIIFYNPNNPLIAYVAHKSSILLKKNDDPLWWISQLVIPLEQGLIIYSNNTSPISSTYAKTEYACDKLIQIFHCLRNPNRIYSLS